MKTVLTGLSKALTSLDEALALPKTPVVRDSAIKRFEYTYELACNALRRQIGEELGGHVLAGISRKDIFRLAAQQKLIADARAWFDYHHTRNLTSHTYDEKRAEEAYGFIVRFAEDARRLLAELEERNG